MTCQLDVSYQFLTFVALPFFLKEYMFIFNIILKIDKNNISRFLKKKIYNYPYPPCDANLEKRVKFYHNSFKINFCAFLK